MPAKFDPTFLSRPLSWSQISSFEYSPSQWYDTYILGNRQTSKEMTYGSLVDKRFQDDPTFLPDVPRGELLQHKLKAVFDGIHMVGVPDILSLKEELYLADLKTGKKAWDKKRADETGQLTFYLLLLWIQYKVKPEDFRLAIHWLPTKETEEFKITDVDGVVRTIETTRTMRDILLFTKRIKKVIGDMEAYLSTVDPSHTVR